MDGEGLAKTVLMSMWYMLVGIFYICKYIVFGIIYLVRLFRSAMPKEFHSSYTSRFEHTLIVGGSGHGKTQLMQYLMVASKDLENVAAGKQSLIVIDSQGDMINKILSLAQLSPGSPLAERLVLIDPTDVDNPPCLNLFDFGLDRVKGYSTLEKEMLMNGAVAMYEYIFGSLLGSELTNKQDVVFRYIAQLLVVVPGATIYTLLDFMDEPELVRPYLPKLDIAAQRFFLTRFFSPEFEPTRSQIAHRLWGVLSTPTLRKLFSHQHNKLNMFEAMNRGSLILVNTAKNLLKQEDCELFGRFIIALLTQATQERAAIPQEERKPTFVYIDEAHDYFDDNIELLLNTARKYNVGITLATQNLGQFDRRLLKTVLSSTSIKYAGGVSDADARELAPEMRCEPQFIMSMGKTQQESHFAFYDKNAGLTKPASYLVYFGVLESQPKMTPENREQLLEDNRERYCAPYDPNLLMGSQALANAGIQFDLEEARPL